MKSVNVYNHALAMLCLFGVLLATNTPLLAQTLSLGQMPVIKAQTLNERELTLPRDLPGDKTLVLIAFEREQQKNVNTWIAGMKLGDNPFPWVETPVIEPRGSLSRAFIDGGMRMGIRDVITREKTITLYTDRLAFVRAMGLRGSIETIHAAVVNRAGQVLASVEGDYSKEKEAVLLKALAQQP
jgi:hypothetical protein